MYIRKDQVLCKTLKDQVGTVDGVELVESISGKLTQVGVAGDVDK